MIKNIFTILIVIALLSSFSFAHPVTKTATLWHFTKLDNIESHVNWKPYQNDTIC